MRRGGPADAEHLIEPLPLKNLIAQKDIMCSNSVIEEMNKILKCQNLSQKPVPDAEHLPVAERETIDDFNNRPNGKHRGLTPNEAYAGKVFDKAAYYDRTVKAGIERRAVNRNACPPCVAIEDFHRATQPESKATE